MASATAQQGRVSNLYRTLANSPAMLGAWTGMAWPLRHQPKLERRLRELGIMRVAQRSRAVYEWAHHWHLATDCGVPEAQLRALINVWVSHVATHRDHMTVFNEERRVLESGPEWKRVRTERDFDYFF